MIIYRKLEDRQNKNNRLDISMGGIKAKSMDARCPKSKVLLQVEKWTGYCLFGGSIYLKEFEEVKHFNAITIFGFPYTPIL